MYRVSDVSYVTIIVETYDKRDANWGLRRESLVNDLPNLPTGLEWIFRKCNIWALDMKLPAEDN